MPEEEDRDPAASEDEEPVEDPTSSISADSFVTFTASTWRVARVHFGTIFVAFAIANIIIYASVFTVARTSLGDSDSAGLTLFIAARFLLPGVIGGYIAAAVAHTRTEVLRSRAASVGLGINRIRDVWGHVIAACLLASVLSALIFLAFSFLGIVLGLALRLGPPVLLLVIAFEKESLASGWPRTRALIRGNALRILTYLTLTALMITVLLLLIGTLIAVAIDPLDLTNRATSLILDGFGTFADALLYVFLSAGLLVTYIDCRRREDEDFSIDELTGETEQ